MAPLQADAGFVVLINRGFVTPEQTTASNHYTSPGADQDVSLSGLLRMTEPRGGFLRKNAPAQGRWYSRDVVAIAQARQLAIVAPYFIDADAGVGATAGFNAAPGSGPTAPVGGLTVIAFRNTHLQYAFTWLALAGLSAFAAVRVALNR
jgi:surfeit locus 1 family protein